MLSALKDLKRKGHLTIYQEVIEPMKNTKDLHLMFVDNDSHVRESLKVFFDNSQIKFLIFKSAAEGLNSLKYQQMDVVVSDYFLSDMDGVEFLKQAALTQPGVTRVLMATLSSDDLEKQIVEAGIDRFIEKPLTVASLDVVIKELGMDNLSKRSRR